MLTDNVPLLLYPAVCVLNDSQIVIMGGSERVNWHAHTSAVFILDTETNTTKKVAEDNGELKFHTFNN